MEDVYWSIMFAIGVFFGVILTVIANELNKIRRRRLQRRSRKKLLESEYTFPQYCYTCARSTEHVLDDLRGYDVCLRCGE